jgi:molecular chaperone GrpE
MAQPDLKAELDAASRKAAENYDLYLRARAELENARRRAQEEVAKTHKFAIESFAESLVPVVDSLERALESDVTGRDPLREGVQITLKQLLTAFEKARLTEINPVGERFDPHRHQAISMVPAGQSNGVPPNHVVNVLQKGWMISDRVLRPALVTVSQGS